MMLVAFHTYVFVSISATPFVSFCVDIYNPQVSFYHLSTFLYSPSQYWWWLSSPHPPPTQIPSRGGFACGLSESALVHRHSASHLFPALLFVFRNNAPATLYNYKHPPRRRHIYQQTPPSTPTNPDKTSITSQKSIFYNGRRKGKIIRRQELRREEWTR